VSVFKYIFRQSSENDVIEYCFVDLLCDLTLKAPVQFNCCGQISRFGIDVEVSFNCYVSILWKYCSYATIFERSKEFFNQSQLVRHVL